MAEQSKTNQMAVPEAKAAMNRFKEEVASELGVPLKEGYNGDLTSAQAGSIGGEMVKKMIMKQEQQMSGKLKKKYMRKYVRSYHMNILETIIYINYKQIMSMVRVNTELYIKDMQRSCSNISAHMQNVLHLMR